MSEEKSTIPVNIFGNKYTISGEADSEYIRELAQYVNDRMREITNHTGEVDSTKVAILTALNIADELYQLKEKKDENTGDFDAKLEELTKKLDKGLAGRFTGE